MGRDLKILMADDSESDILFVKHALEASGVGQFFHAVHDGAEVISYLRGEGKYADRAQYPFPNVLLSDLKMPGLDGYGLLAWLRHHTECSIIPTIIFTSSALPSDVLHVYQQGANAFITKPSSLDLLIQLIRKIYEFWSICEIPPPPIGQKCA